MASLILFKMMSDFGVRVQEAGRLRVSSCVENGRKFVHAGLTDCNMFCASEKPFHCFISSLWGLRQIGGESRSVLASEKLQLISAALRSKKPRVGSVEWGSVL